MRGFTIMEMMVALAITGTVLGVASPVISELRSEYQLEGFSRRIANEVSTARMQAIAQNRTIRVRTSGLYAYVIEASENGTTFTPVGQPISMPPGMLVLQGSTGGPKFNRQGMATAVSNLYVVNGAGVQTIQTTRLGRVSRF